MRSTKAKVLVTFAAVLAGSVLPAQATGDLYCWGKDETVGPLNRGGVFMHFVYGMSISSVQQKTAMGKRWSNNSDEMARGALPIHVSDANDVGDTVVISADFSATLSGPVIATLRTFLITEGQAGNAQPYLISGGVFNLKGVGFWPLACFGP